MATNASRIAASATEPPTPADPPVDDPPAASRQAASLANQHGPMPQPLRGSSESLERQNDRLEAEGLERIEDDHDLDGRIARKLLVPVPVSAALAINQNIPPRRRYCRPWTARFLADLARAHQATFHSRLEVSSAVRTVAYQKRLQQINGNAAPAEGDVVSPHLTGSAVDLPKDNLTRKELAWMRRYLLVLQQAGKVDVEEEFQQACFHVTVYKSYLPAHPAAKPPAKPSSPRALRASAKLGAPTAAELAQPAVQPTAVKGRPRAAKPLHPAPAAAEPAQVVVDGE